MCSSSPEVSSSIKKGGNDFSRPIQRPDVQKPIRSTYNEWTNFEQNKKRGKDIRNDALLSAQLKLSQSAETRNCKTRGFQL